MSVHFPQPLSPKNAERPEHPVDPEPRSKLFPEIHAALARGACVLTSNARAARVLNRLFAEDARASGLRSWPAPPIHDWTSWTEQLYARIPSSRPLLLSPLQEELLWRRVQAPESELVVSADRLAQLAASGYALLSAYRAHPNRRAPWAAAYEDAERFLAWAQAFDELCERLSAMPRAHLTHWLATHAAELPAQGELLLVGFDRLTPAQQQLLAILAEAGARVAHATPQQPAPDIQIMCATDEAEELRACALWVRARLLENRAQRIAILLPDQRAGRAALDRTFSRVLQSEGDGELPYEFSLGVPLSGIPLISSALLLLRWLAHPLPAAEITTLLTSGFLAGDAHESLALAEADRALRKAGALTTELAFADLLHHAGLLPPSFVQRLRASESLLRREVQKQRRSYADWTAVAAQLLRTLGWPGFEPLDSLAFQAQTRWDSLLTEVGRLGFFSNHPTWADFVGALTHAAHNTLFAAESRSAPVQILGIAEAAGQQFDALWFLQVTEDRWPARGRMHPLLAPGLQRDAGMPHASLEADLALAHHQQRRILASAPAVVFSYARQCASAATRPSPLLRSLSTVAAPAGPNELPNTPCLTVRDVDSPTVAPWPADRVAGGSDVLKRQAACGFQSFAAKRLGAIPLEDESWGLDARGRALLLHRALEELWSAEPASPGENRLHTHADLLRAIAEGTLNECVAAAVARSFERPMREAAGDRWRVRYLELEQQRLCNRLLCWLAVEERRAPFTVVGVEKKLEGVEVGPLRLNLRVDRIDRIEQADLPSGAHLLLDYKTAEKVQTGLWNGDRPDEPQLPIYALFGGIERVAGIVFAQIRARKTKVHGLTEDPEQQLGPAPRKEAAPRRLLRSEMREEWDRALRALAVQFARGEAPVNPKRGEETCRLCGLYGLCRVREQAPSLNRGSQEHAHGS